MPQHRQLDFEIIGRCNSFRESHFVYVIWVSLRVLVLRFVNFRPIWNSNEFSYRIRSSNCFRCSISFEEKQIICLVLPLLFIFVLWFPWQEKGKSSEWFILNWNLVNIQNSTNRFTRFRSLRLLPTLTFARLWYDKRDPSLECVILSIHNRKSKKPILQSGKNVCIC